MRVPFIQFEYAKKTPYLFYKHCNFNAKTKRIIKMLIERVATNNQLSLTFWTTLLFSILIALL